MKAYLSVAAAVAGCSPHAAGLPPGPPPEYERPALPAWDAGKASAKATEPAERAAADAGTAPAPKGGPMPPERAP